ncbi:MAG: hypothetical protein PHU97_08095 [Bacteroidales bacterium]|nr:hypothetical protein [Bacteroidales bacterium]
MTKLYFLPWKFSFEKLIIQYPPPKGIKELEVYIVLSRVIELQSFIKDAGESMFVPLNYDRMRQLGVRNFKLYHCYLTASEVLECNNHFVPGVESRRYRFSIRYHGKIKAVTVDETTTLKSQAAANQTFYKPHKGLVNLANWFDNKLEIDRENAIKYLKTQYRNSNIPLEKRVHRYNRGLVLIENMYRHKFAFKEDKTSGRVHTNLTYINKPLRNYITYKGYNLVSIDIKNSQPFFSIALFRESFYSIERTEQFNLASLYSSSIAYKASTQNTSISFKDYGRSSNSNNKDIDDTDDMYIKDFYVDDLYKSILSNKSGRSHFYSIIPYNKVQMVECEDVKLYKDLVGNGMFYEYLMQVLNSSIQLRYNGFERMTRSEVKTETMFILYSSNHIYSQPYAWAKRIFRENFPNVYEVFKIIKRRDYVRLPVLLQAIEAEIVLHRAAKRISRERRRLPIFTIHDSIVTTEGDEEYVKSVLEDEMRKR